MKTVEKFSGSVRVMDPAFIALSDGVRLTGKIRLPEDADEVFVPAALEYTPYRYQNGAAESASLSHPYFACRGYASVRVDMRGSGNSGGALLSEYQKSKSTRSR